MKLHQLKESSDSVSLPSLSLSRIWSICARGWRAGRPIPWPCSLIRCCSPTVTSDWTTRLRWSGDTSRSAPSLTWCWGRVRLEEPGMYADIYWLIIDIKIVFRCLMSDYWPPCWLEQYQPTCSLNRDDINSWTEDYPFLIGCNILKYYI